MMMGESTDVFGPISIILGTIFMVFALYARNYKRYSSIILLGYFIRLFILLADYNKWFPIIHSGADSEMFNYLAIENQITSTPWYLTNYTMFLTWIYGLTDCSRLFAQYINVLFGMGVILCVEKIFRLVSLDRKVEKNAIYILVFFPHLIIFSSILLREAWIQFFCSLSVLFYLRWYIKGSLVSFLNSILSLLAAVWMHTGVFGLILGYIISFVLYNPKKRKINLGFSTFISVGILIVGGMVLLMYSDLLLDEKAATFESGEDFVELTNIKTTGESAYLTWINSESIGQSLLFAPLKMFYFLFSPIPIDWRGLGDITAFIIDSSIYAYLFYTIFNSKIQYVPVRNLKNFLLISIMSGVFIFAFGTFTAGTAMRHRSKLIPLILLTSAISISYSKKTTYKHINR